MKMHKTGWMSITRSLKKDKIEFKRNEEKIMERGREKEKGLKESYDEMR